MAFQQATFGQEVEMMPQIVDGNWGTANATTMAANPLPVPPADPAHLGEQEPTTTAAVPIVNPH
jgi:hypothetical protein